MKNKSFWYSLILAGMSLGTAWAIRGQFGHEYGAAWAGAVGSLSVLLLAKRPDWYNKAFRATLAGSLGWGLGGIMSYGVVVGYGRGIEFVNVYYGLLMLFVIGGLYGYVGGALFGLSLTSTRQTKVPWPQLIVEMTVGGILFYFFLIEEFGWLMTPPRSEVWAVCLGVALALTWYLVRQQHYAALRVAVFAGLGGGFGFAFGNFLQVLGNVAEIKFNFWNVMEYSLGFFGGAGMAYGTYTARWEQSDEPETKAGVLVPLLLLVLLIPFIVWEQSFGTERVTKIYSAITDNLALVSAVQGLSLLLLLLLAAIWFNKYYLSPKTDALRYGEADIRTLFLGHFGLYTAFSLLITGAVISTYRIEQYLYVVNFIVIALLIGKVQAPFVPREVPPRKWLLGFLAVVAFLALLAFILIHSHAELPHANKRFE
ncbi:hypothetical protein GCM10027275_21760 [Rhabdobacter roseus]|uniref:DUF3464 family protein n=1 Tax=Rhabdobacter roseus TaxID=1655419 RepID=A0A840TKS3_9BACT|nr:hypothetical protein [Rhabdobacter roseus]MBB5284111.1 hypothetical protein [Rhabdobacter roseus]